MRARGHGIANLGAGNHRTNRKTAAKPLCNSNDIGTNTRCFIGKQRTRPADAGLYFISNHKGAKFISRRAHTPQVVIMRVTRPALALYRLDHDGGNMRTKGIAQCIQIAKSDMLKPLGHGTKAGAVGLFVCCCQHAKCTAVKRPGGTQDCCPLGFTALIGGAARDLDRAFISLSARITEIHLIKTSEGCQSFGNALLSRNTVKV